MKNNKVVLSATAVAILCGLNSYNALATNKGNDEVVVTAGRFMQPVSSVLAPVTIVNKEEIDKWQSNSIVDVLRRLPGVDISQTGGIGQSSSLYIRGTDAKHVLVLIDGVRFNNAGIGGAVSINQFPIALVQRIEYIRGPRSAVYGSDAIGGVLNIITQRDDMETNLTAGIGSHGYQNYTGTLSQKIGENTRITAAGGYTYSKGFDIISDYSGRYKPDNRRYGFLNKTLWIGVDHQFNEQISAFARGYSFDNNSDYAGYSKSDTNTRDMESRTFDTGINFTEGRYSSQLIFSLNRTKDYNFNNELGRYDSSSTLDDSKQYSAQWGNHIQIGAGGISTGVDYQKQTIEPGTAMTADNQSITTTGLYLTGQQEVGKVLLEAAVRSDHHSDFDWHTTWQTSAGWEFIDGYRLIGSYGTAYKAPNIGQLYADYPAWNIKGNPNLKPEESKQWEAGIEGITGSLDWKFTAYHNDIENLIDFKDNTYKNISKAKIKGLEWTGEIDTGIFHHQLTYQYIDPRDKETNKTLYKRAKQQVKYQLDWTTYDIDWGVTYQYIGVRYDQNTSTYQREKMGGISLWDLTAAYPITDHLTIRGRIANLLDKDYETAYGYRTAGREYYLTGSYNF